MCTRYSLNSTFEFVYCLLIACINNVKGFQGNVRPEIYIVVETVKAVEETMNPSGHKMSPLFNG